MILQHARLRVEASILHRLSRAKEKGKARLARAVAAANGAKAPGAKVKASFQPLMNGLLKLEGLGTLGVPSAPAQRQAQSGQEQLHPRLNPGCRHQLHLRGQAPQRPQPQALNGPLLLRLFGHLPEDSPL